MSKVISHRRVFVQLYLSLSLLASCYSAHAQAVEENSYELAKQYQQGEAWSLYPFTIQINPYLGVTMPFTPLEITDDNELQLNKDKLLWIKEGSADISLLYVGQTIWKHFDCYPRAGLKVNCGKLANKGHIVGGLFYIEPNYNHLTGWEVVPRLGIGIAHVVVSESQLQTEGQAAEFRRGYSLALAFGLLLKYRLTPRWHLHTGVDLDYLPYLNKTKEEASKDLTIYKASVGGSCTVNPSPYNYPRPQRPRKSSIDIAFLNSFRKVNPTLVEDLNPQGEYHQEDDKYYYVGGLHGQWSLQVGRNHAFTLATEWIKDRATKKELERQYRQDDLKASFLVGHEFLWGKLVFGQQLGIYAMSDTIYLPFRLFYTRLGFNYRFTNFLFMGVSLKTAVLPTKRDLTKIDFIDLRIGYSF